MTRPASSSATHAQGLHILRVVQAARDVVVACEALGGVEKMPGRTMREPIRDLVTVMNALLQFERSAAAHGIALPSTGEAAELALARSIGLLSRSAAALASQDAGATEEDFTIKGPAEPWKV